MKVYIGPYKKYYGVHAIVEAIFFWQERYPSRELESRWDYVLSYKLSDYLSETWVNTFLQKINDLRPKRKIKIKIHKYDSWNLDGTLTPIILPLLKQLRATKHGSGFIEMEDVPEYMRTTSTQEYEAQSVFEFYKMDSQQEENTKYNVHHRYDWVLDEMIWAFEQLQPGVDWEDQYWIVHPEMDFTQHPEDEGSSTVPVRWKVQGECDWVGRQAHQDRISNGLRLFGKYFETLWT